MEYSDQKLVQLFRDEHRKEEAFTLIVNKYKEKIYWHIRKLVILHDDTDDILQNVFVRIWKGLENFREDSFIIISAFVYIKTVAKNFCNGVVFPYEIDNFNIRILKDVNIKISFLSSQALLKCP